jgi:hypothetical protein
MEKPFKAIISLANMELDASLKDDLKCIISAESDKKVSDVPFREVYCFDLSGECERIEIRFTQDDIEIASTELKLPEEIHSQAEFEMHEKLRLPVKNIEVDLQHISATFNITYINTQMFETRLATKEDDGGSKDVSFGKRNKKEFSDAGEKSKLAEKNTKSANLNKKSDLDCNGGGSETINAKKVGKSGDKCSAKDADKDKWKVLMEEREQRDQRRADQKEAKEKRQQAAKERPSQEDFERPEKNEKFKKAGKTPPTINVPKAREARDSAKSGGSPDNEDSKAKALRPAPLTTKPSKKLSIIDKPVTTRNKTPVRGGQAKNDNFSCPKGYESVPSHAQGMQTPIQGGSKIGHHHSPRSNISNSNNAFKAYGQPPSGPRHGHSGSNSHSTKKGQES